MEIFCDVIKSLRVYNDSWSTFSWEIIDMFAVKKGCATCEESLVNGKIDQPSALLLSKVSEIARNALKVLISENLPATPVNYEKTFYNKAMEMGETELVDHINSSFPVGQKAALMVEGVSSVISNLNEDIRNYRSGIDDYGGKIEKQQGLIQQTVPPDIWLVFEKHLSDLQNANNQMRVQIEIAESRLQKQEEKVSQLQRENRRDPLTGARNRLAMDEDLPTEFARNKRYNRGFSIVMADIDHFKRINDAYGHAVGDEVLQIFVQRLQKTLREVDIIYRYGGEEFLVFLPETSAAVALSVAERLRKSVDAKALKQNDDPSITFRVTASFGVSSVNGKMDASYMDTIKRADQALYNAKNGGRNRVDSVFS